VRIAIAASPEVAIPTIEALSKSSFQLVRVISQPDRPAGRGKVLTPTPVSQWAIENGVELLRPSNSEEIAAAVEGLDCVITIGYGVLLPEQILEIPTFGFLILAGVAAGLTGSIAGLASVASYPALLLVGLSPIQANVTNTIALSALSFGSISASKPEWQTQKPLLKRLIPAVLLGGISGGLLLLNTDPVTFGMIAPLLIIGSSFVVLIPRKENAKPILQRPWQLATVM
jgi:hypothetical protein